jgi:chromosome segregation ATPase
MTYSQRLTQASSSDISYLEYQIGAAEEELKQTEGQQIIYESELNQLRMSLENDSSSISPRDTDRELKLQIQIAEVKSRMEAIRTRLIQLQDDMEKLAD